MDKVPVASFSTSGDESGLSQVPNEITHLAWHTSSLSAFVMSCVNGRFLILLLHQGSTSYISCQSRMDTGNYVLSLFALNA